MREEAQLNLIRSLLSINLLVFIGNADFGFYIIIRMMIPQKVRFVLLWLFYIIAIILSLLEITLMIYLLIYPDKVYQCYIYSRSFASILHCIVCSMIVACGFVAIATMKQIRLSLLVILKDITKEQAMRKLRCSLAFLTSCWCIN